MLVFAFKPLHENPLRPSCVLGDIALANRIVMAPLTRDRAGPGQVPTALMAEYYRQRASAGLDRHRGEPSLR